MSSFFSELKRRNVFKVATAYVVVGWLTLQVFDSVAEPLGFPAWVLSFIIVLIAVGLPIALLFAWAFEMTPDGVKRTGNVDPNASTTPATGQKINYIIIGALVLVIGGLAYERLTLGGTSEEPAVVVIENTPPSIAVLAFKDFSPNGDQEYFADGIADEILNLLVKTNAMKVTGRTSSFSFKGSKDDIPTIAQKLNVEHVLEGSISKFDNTFKITVQLNDASGIHLWSETYKSELINIFDIQEKIAAAIIRELKAQLLGEGTAVADGTDNMEAYQFYLKGKYALSQRAARRGNAVAEAIELFETATKLDPTYTNAFAALARAYGWANNYEVEGVFQEQVAKARVAAEKALSLNPDNVDALVSSALVKYQYDGNFVGAAQEFKRALSLQPNNSAAYNLYGDLLTTIYDHDGALEMERKAFEYDPLSQINALEYGGALLRAGKIDEGLAVSEIGMNMYPTRLYRHQIIHLYEFSGRPEGAARWEKKLFELWPDHNHFTQEPLFDLLDAGDESVRQKILASFDGDSYNLMQFYYFRGKYDQAIIWLDKFYQEGINYFLVTGFEGFDPSIVIDHAGWNEALNRPGLKNLIDIRRKNLGLLPE